EHFGSGVDDQSDKLVFKLHDENAVLFVGLNFRLAKTLAQVHHRNDFAAQVYDTLDQIGSARDSGNLRNADNFTHGADADSIRFIADPKTHYLKILFHQEVSGPLGSRQFRVLGFLVAIFFVATTLRCFSTSQALLGGAIQNKTVHAVKQIAREFQHLFGSGRKLSSAGGGLLHQFTHLVHGSNNGLRTRGLFFDRGVDFLRNFREAAGGLGDLRGAHRLLVGRRADFLGELVDFGDYVRDFVQRGTKFIAEVQPFLDDARAALHVFDGLARFALNALDEVGDFFRGLRGLFRQLADFVRDLFDGLDASDHFFARAIGDVQQNFCGVRDALNRSDHLIDGSGGFRDAGGLNLGVFHYVLHVDAHLVHGAADFLNGGRSLNADLGRFVGGARHLIGAGGDLTCGIARGAHQ